MELGQTLLISNPTAQSGAGEPATRQAEALMRKQMPDGPDVIRTRASGHAAELAAQLGAAYDTVIALGGDGVIHEVVNGLMTLDASTRPNLGVIPVGSGNDYARSLGISFRVSEAVSQLFTLKPQLTDVGCVNGVYFTETLSFGLDAAIALGTMERRKKSGKSGTMLYLEEGVDQFLHHLVFHPYELSAMTASGDVELKKQGRAILIAIQVGPTYGGGFKICPDARLDDGALDLCVANGPIATLRALKVFLSAKNGHHVNHPAVSISKVRELVVRFEDTPLCQVDGEPLTASEYRVRVVPQALKVMRL